VLFDPFEKDFNVPAVSVELRDGEGGEQEVVGQEGETFVGGSVVVADTAERSGIGVPGGDAGQPDGLVRAQSDAAVHRA
jgi:hypothetical protein